MLFKDTLASIESGSNISELFQKLLEYKKRRAATAWNEEISNICFFIELNKRNEIERDLYQLHNSMKLI